MNNNIFLKKHVETIFIAVIVGAVGAVWLWYGNTEVAFKIQDDVLYRQIKNGRVGTNCYDESGTKVIALSRFFGPEWVKVASLESVPAFGKTFSITCYPYASASDASPVSATISLVGGE